MLNTANPTATPLPAPDHPMFTRPSDDGGAAELRERRDEQRQGRETAQQSAEWFDTAAKMIEPGAIAMIGITPDGQVTLDANRGNEPSAPGRMLTLDESKRLRVHLRNFFMELADEATVSVNARVIRSM